MRRLLPNHRTALAIIGVLAIVGHGTVADAGCRFDGRSGGHSSCRYESLVGC
jgi:hypothetical protein